jgi:uncharacterized repeat protein (TIGR03803 family)
MQHPFQLLLKSITTAAFGLCVLFYAPRLDAQPNTVTTLNTLGGQSAAVGPSDPVVVDLWQFESLYSFTNGTDGNIPQGGLTLASDGDLYGVSLEGGDGFSGTIYKVGTNGVFTVLYPFTGGDDGGTPYAGLTLASDGLLYGTTSLGGTNGGGTIFDISTNGNFQVLNDFSGLGVNGWGSRRADDPGERRLSLWNNFAGRRESRRKYFPRLDQRCVDQFLFVFRIGRVRAHGAFASGQ